jgi:serine/threonine protein kinase
MLGSFGAAVCSGSEGAVHDAVVKVKRSPASAEREYMAMRCCCSRYVPHVELAGAMLVMPKAETDVLGLLVRTKRLLDYPVMCRVAEEMAGAVRLVHARGFIHRDVKLENFLVYDLVERAGVVVALRVLLSDFGFAVKVEPGELVAHRLGSPSYVAPEIARGRLYGQEADVFSYAVCVFTMLTGHKPFQANDYSAVPLAAKRMWKAVSITMGPAMKRLVLLGLRVDPATRLTSLQCVRLAHAARRASNLRA